MSDIGKKRIYAEYLAKKIKTDPSFELQKVIDDFRTYYTSDQFEAYIYNNWQLVDNVDEIHYNIGLPSMYYKNGKLFWEMGRYYDTNGKPIESESIVEALYTTP